MRVLKQILNWAVAAAWLPVAGAYLGFLGTRWIPSRLADWCGLLLYFVAGLTLSALVLLPFWDRRTASRFGIWLTMPIAVVIGYVTYRSSVFLDVEIRAALVASAVLWLVTPAIYWKVTEARQWPPVVNSRRRSAVSITAGIVTLLLGVIFTILYAVHISEIDDCERTALPYAHQQSERHVIAVARVIHTSVIFGTVAFVDQEYWGLPWWNHKLVFFRPVSYWRGKTLLIDARRQGGFLSEVIPVLRFSCGTRTKPIEFANVDLRVLRDGPQPGFRIIGSVSTYRSYADDSTVPAPGVVVEADGGNRKFTATTDEHGVFDFKNLPLGRYRVTAPAAKGWECDPYPYPWKEVESGDVGECVLHASTKRP